MAGSSGSEGVTMAGSSGCSGLTQHAAGGASSPVGLQQLAAVDSSSPAGQLDTRLGPAISNLGDVYRIKVSVPLGDVPLQTHCTLYFPPCTSGPEVPVLPSHIRRTFSSLSRHQGQKSTLSSLRARSPRHSAATGWPRHCKWTFRGHGCGWGRPAGTPGSTQRRRRRLAEQSGSTRRGASGTRRSLAWCSVNR